MCYIPSMHIRMYMFVFNLIIIIKCDNTAIRVCIFCQASYLSEECQTHLPQVHVQIPSPTLSVASSLNTTLPPRLHFGQAFVKRRTSQLNLRHLVNNKQSGPCLARGCQQTCRVTRGLRKKGERKRLHTKGPQRRRK